MLIVQEIPKILFNILIFIIVQSLFFYTISAGFANNIIADKVSRISDLFYKQLQRPQKELLLRQLKEDRESIVEQVNKDKAERDKKNQIFLLYRMGIPAAITLGLFLISLYMLGAGGVSLQGIVNTFSSWSGLKSSLAAGSVYIFMLFAYLTEVGIYTILMQRYEYIGTFEILDIINKELPELDLNIFNE